VDLARASKRLILTAERIVDTAEDFAANRPVLPSRSGWSMQCVWSQAAVIRPKCLMNTHPMSSISLRLDRQLSAMQMHFQEFLIVTSTAVKDFDAYLELACGAARMAETARSRAAKTALMGSWRKCEYG
jgi:hypothetical protein